MGSWEDVELVPEPSAAEIEPSVNRLCDQITRADEPAICVAHSAACQVVLRSLGRVPGGRIAGALLVAPWFELDAPWDAIRPWTTEPMDPEAGKTAGVRIRAVLSDNDPFTADFAKTRTELERGFAANVRIVTGRGHFNEPEEPAVLEELLALMAG